MLGIDYYNTTAIHSDKLQRDLVRVFGGVHVLYGVHAAVLDA